MLCPGGSGENLCSYPFQLLESSCISWRLAPCIEKMFALTHCSQNTLYFTSGYQMCVGFPQHRAILPHRLGAPQFSSALKTRTPGESTGPSGKVPPSQTSDAGHQPRLSPVLLAQNQRFLQPLLGFHQSVGVARRALGNSLLTGLLACYKELFCRRAQQGGQVRITRLERWETVADPQHRSLGLLLTVSAQHRSVRAGKG